MKKQLPYKWTPQDHPEFIAMTPELRGCYRSLIDHCWTAGAIPKDSISMAAICGYSPAEKFHKEIWTMLRDHFCPLPGGDWSYLAFDEQIKRSKKLSKLQSIRAKALWAKVKDAMPSACRMNAEVMPDSFHEEIKETPFRALDAAGMPSAYQNDAGLMPELNREETTNEPEAEPMPTACRIDAETMPELPKEKLSIEPAKVDNKIIEKSVSDSSKPDRYFDALPAWEEFSKLYPGFETEVNSQDVEDFLKIVVNQFWYDRILRALTNYKTHLFEHNWNAQDLTYWLGEWKAWEDPGEPDDAKHPEVSREKEEKQ